MESIQEKEKMDRNKEKKIKRNTDGKDKNKDSIGWLKCEIEMSKDGTYRNRNEGGNRGGWKQDGSRLGAGWEQDGSSHLQLSPRVEGQQPVHPVELPGEDFMDNFRKRLELHTKVKMFEL